MDSAYAHRYFGRRYLIVLSLAHFLIVGERRGNRPNPFYDPIFARAQGIPSLACYLRDRTLWQAPTSAQFDPAFRPATSSATNPLVDFWRCDFTTAGDPAPDFDLAYFNTVVAFYRADKKEFAFEVLTAPGRPAPTTAAAHEARTQAFYAGIDLAILRRPGASLRRFLVFIQADRSFTNVFTDAARSFDVLINDYAAPAAASTSDYHAGFDYVTTQRGTKTTAIRKMLADAPDILLAYDFVLFLDDDVAMDTASIDRLFAIVAAAGLDLAQASLTETSFCAFDILKQPMAGTGLTPLTAVEIMMPVLSHRVLRDCGWVFGAAISGWAVDFLLGSEVRKRFGDRIALVGDVVASHERDIDTQEGAFYRFLRVHGIEATTEAGLIAMRHGIEVSAKAIRRHPAPLEG